MTDRELPGAELSRRFFTGVVEPLLSRAVAAARLGSGSDATVTADGRPLAGPVDGYFLHGEFWFSSARNSVRMRHLTARPAVTATYLDGEELAVTVHGRAELFDLHGPDGAGLRQAMLDHWPGVRGVAEPGGRRRRADRGGQDVHLRRARLRPAARRRLAR